MRLRNVASLAVLVAGLSGIVLLTRHIHLSSGSAHGTFTSSEDASFRVSDLLRELSKPNAPIDTFTEGQTTQLQTIASAMNTSEEPAKADAKVSCNTRVELCSLPPYMVYWKEEPKEDCGVRSPLRCSGPKPKYVTFQPDAGGWNNIRMSMETAVIYAAATGRILVLPRKQFFYLLTRNKQWADNKMTFDSIYHMDKLVDVLDMMPMKDFLETEGHAQGYLKEPYPQIANFESVPSQELFTWIQERTHMEQPSTDKRVMGFTFNFSFAQHPNPCAAPQAEQLFSTGVRLDDRLKTFLMHRTLSEYDMHLHNQPVIHFPSTYKGGYRLLTHFYTWLYFSDTKADRFYKRFARDRLRYRDEIWCAAAKIVKLLKAQALEMGIEDGSYAAYHIRRGDFQYKETRVSVRDIVQNTQDLLRPGQLVYVATDETDKTMFKPFEAAGFRIRFFAGLAATAGLGKEKDLSGENTEQQNADGSLQLDMNHVGMIEQIICANGERFIGTPYSTFTGFITRMRGYYNDTRSAQTYYTLPKFKYQLQTTPQFVGPLWGREFQAAWKDIDVL